MEEKFVEPIIDTFFGWVAPDGGIQLMLVAPDIPMLLGVTKMMSQKGLSHSAKEMIKKGFTIHELKTDIQNIKQVHIDASITAAIML